MQAGSGCATASRRGELVPACPSPPISVWSLVSLLQPRERSPGRCFVFVVLAEKQSPFSSGVTHV